ncbi:MAG: 1,4-alpha-glucan branching protein GlgB [Alphaproteobacteria bacterium]|nr:1,4-alpha-glucan branching protein GlgB [Alphaproteobacteria bacterium]
MNDVARDLQAILNAMHPDPFGFLGLHGDGGELVLRSFQPGARAVTVLTLGDRKPVAALSPHDGSGLFEARIRRRRRFRYLLRVEWPDAVQEIEDPYAFPPILGEMDAYLLAEGTHRSPWAVLGAHPAILEGSAGVAFALWAPNAAAASVIGDFNRWDGRRHPMRRRHDCGCFELFVPGLDPGQRYKFELKGPDGAVLPQKADPYARQAERPPATASVVAGESRHRWADAAWLDRRRAADARPRPMSTYEVHLGSWRRNPDEGDRYLTYAELADQLVDYVDGMGFTHVELLPITEHPFDGSWGYQPVGLYAPTSRFGTPDDLRALVDRFHARGIGVVLDWVPGHFPEDAHGLARFDGTHLYEHADPRQGRHMDWGTLIYNYGRREVANFLMGSALYWLSEFHADALRVDAVASMLYLDYSRGADEWVPNRFGGRENLEAIDFLRRTNALIRAQAPGTLTIAEESTAWPGVSRPETEGGLGFSFKWNMGWMHDTLDYMSRDPIHRRHHHDQLSFGLTYAFSENYVLPLSHDEVVHGKRSLIGRMPGDRWQRFASLRAYYVFMHGHPGKKLLFMGGELAQEREWNHDRSLDWHLLDDPLHRGVQALVRDLNRLHREVRALHERDTTPDGFEWIAHDDHENSVLSFLRWARDPDDLVVVVCNFTPVPRSGYRVGVPRPGRYAEMLNSDAAAFGGTNVGNLGIVEAAYHGSHGRPWSLDLTLPPLGGLILRHIGDG